jgi:aryl-alcohol dehydrogenase-like predicted oxidoreductase
MNYRNMGKTGLQVSELCLGAMTFGRESSEAVSAQMLNLFVEHGGNFIDTADAYSAGLSEEILGRWLKEKTREDFVIATKVRFGTREGVNQSGLSRKHIRAAVEASLRRLQTDYIDLYQTHMWDASTPLEETLGTLDDLVREGKVRYIGASNLTGWQLQKAIDQSRQHGWEPYTCLQPLYNLLDREAEWELVPICLNEGLGVIPWSPLRGGWLSGKYKRGMTAPEQGTRVQEAGEKGWSEAWEIYNTEHTWQVIDTLFALSKELNKSVAQIALNWLLQMPGVTAPIIGARTITQFQDNLGATGWALSAEQLERLNRASAKRLPYPYAFIR